MTKLFDNRGDDIPVFVTQMSAFPRVRIQSTNDNFGIMDAESYREVHLQYFNHFCQPICGDVRGHRG